MKETTKKQRENLILIHEHILKNDYIEIEDMERITGRDRIKEEFLTSLTDHMPGFFEYEDKDNLPTGLFSLNDDKSLILDKKGKEKARNILEENHNLITAQKEEFKKFKNPDFNKYYTEQIAFHDFKALHEDIKNRIKMILKYQEHFGFDSNFDKEIFNYYDDKPLYEDEHVTLENWLNSPDPEEPEICDRLKELKFTKDKIDCVIEYEREKKKKSSNEVMKEIDGIEIPEENIPEDEQDNFNYDLEPFLSDNEMDSSREDYISYEEQYEKELEDDYQESSDYYYNDNWEDN